MSSRFRVLVSLLLVPCAACAATPLAAPPDASAVPQTTAGPYAITSELQLAAPVPGTASAVLGELADATDGSDDPSRYLVDRIVEALPPGHVQDVAEELAPVIAAYLEVKLSTIAPRFAPGIEAIAQGLERISTRFGTTEVIRIDPDGQAIRSITGIRFDAGRGPMEVELASAGMSDIVAPLATTLDADGHLALGDHVLTLAYGHLLRLGLDRAVIPTVVTGAADLGQALQGLVDCNQLGQLVADELAIPTPGAFATACRVGLEAAAAKLDERLAAIDAAPLELHVTGSALGYDRDGDGAMDVVDDGTWTGTMTYDGASAPLGAGAFRGSRQ